jgi:hypothetical protein
MPPAGSRPVGPMPAQTLDRLEELGKRAIWVRGNTDRSLAAAFDGTFQPSGLPANPPADYFTGCAARIGRAHRTGWQICH